MHREFDSIISSLVQIDARSSIIESCHIPAWVESSCAVESDVRGRHCSSRSSPV